MEPASERERVFSNWGREKSTPGAREAGSRNRLVIRCESNDFPRRCTEHLDVSLEKGTILSHRQMAMYLRVAR